MIGEPDYKFKVVCIGAAGSGKTAIVDRLITSEFNASPKTTIGVDYRPFRVDVEQFVCQLELWDTAGQENYKAVAKSYFRDSVGCVLVFDCTSQNSFDELNFWLTQFRELADPKAAVILVANKVDLEKDRVVSTEAGEEYARDHQLQYLETSAFNGQNISETFQKLTHDIFDLVRSGQMFVSKSGHAAKGPTENTTLASHHIALTEELERYEATVPCAC